MICLEGDVYCKGSVARIVEGRVEDSQHGYLLIPHTPVPCPALPVTMTACATPSRWAGQ